MNARLIDEHGMIHALPDGSTVGSRAACGERAWLTDQSRAVTCLWCAASPRRRGWENAYLSNPCSEVAIGPGSTGPPRNA